ncbi:HAD family hydrolase [Candidatus Bathyarchaeota archaeon]|nr:HAD family hydrolase [Candidatus Bathyarchaeota archaeon]
MNRIKVISFDSEGTLVEPEFSTLIWEHDIPRLYAEKLGLSFGEAKTRLLEEYNRIGDERIEWYDIGYWFKTLGLAGDWRELLRARQSFCRFYPETKGVLERLKDEYTLIVTSNTIREFLEVQLRDLTGFFTRIFSAPSDFREVKKSPEFYRRICGILNVKPEDCAHVGDHAKFDCEVPSQIGISAYHLDRSRRLKGNHIVHDLLEFEKRIKNSNRVKGKIMLKSFKEPKIIKWKTN